MMNRSYEINAFVLLLSAVSASLACAAGSDIKMPTSSNVVKQIELAIEDEIYDRGRQSEYADIGTEGPKSFNVIKLYIQPTISREDPSEKYKSWVIYKLMPEGEVYRMFHIEDNGLVALDGDPKYGFRITGPNYLTLYMDDDQLCNLKNQWLKAAFSVQLNPPKARVDEARLRDQERYGASRRQGP
jgi:hypothetical protein